MTSHFHEQVQLELNQKNYLHSATPSLTATMKKRRPSSLMIALGAIGFVVVMGLSLYFGAKLLIDKLDTGELIAGVGLIFTFILAYEFKNRFMSSKSSIDFLDVAKQIKPELQNELDTLFSKRKNRTKPIVAFQGLLLEKGHAINIDWQGEENNGEIQAFVQSTVKTHIVWANATTLREKIRETKGQEDKFLIALLKAIDDDLKRYHIRLLFLKTDGDSYCLTTVDTTTLKKVANRFGRDFYLADDI